jgi:hypothetical protein
VHPCRCMDTLAETSPESPATGVWCYPYAPVAGLRCVVLVVCIHPNQIIDGHTERLRQRRAWCKMQSSFHRNITGQRHAFLPHVRDVYP